MRVGQYEILLVDTNDEPFPERDIGGQIYTQGEANKEYQVKINVYRDASGYFPAPYLRFTLFVDGVELAAKKRLNVNMLSKNGNALQPVSVTIPGYPSESRSYQSFTFTPPNMTSIAIDELDSELGTIKVVTCEAEATGQYEMFHNYETPRPSTENTARISEHKKFWKQASLGTVAGERVISLSRRNNNNNEDDMIQKWHTVREIPEGTLVLRYHLASNLDFLEEMQSRICSGKIIADGDAVTRPAANPERVVDLARREFIAARNRAQQPYREAAYRAGEKRYRDDRRGVYDERDDDVYSVDSLDDGVRVMSREVRGGTGTNAKYARAEWNA